MNRSRALIVLFLLFRLSVFCQSSTIDSYFDTISLTDSSRHRTIPIAIYSPKTASNKLKLIIVSHGYSQNNGNPYLGYSYLTEFLATKGYLVVSIQHELPTDSLLPLTGIPKIVRRSNWERGVNNILFALHEIKKMYPEIDTNNITLIGHSNGGDMSMLFAHKYPRLVSKIISLDNRRVEIPRAYSPRVYSLRSSDQLADENVIPTNEEQEKYAIKIIKLANTIHNDMSDFANQDQRIEIINYVLDFLKDKINGQ